MSFGGAGAAALAGPILAFGGFQAVNIAGALLLIPALVFLPQALKGAKGPGHADAEVGATEAELATPERAVATEDAMD